jgi:hypothetical protein
METACAGSMAPGYLWRGPVQADPLASSSYADGFRQLDLSRLRLLRLWALPFHAFSRQIVFGQQTRSGI